MRQKQSGMRREREREQRERGHTIAVYARKVVSKLAFPGKEDCGKVAGKQCKNDKG